MKKEVQALWVKDLETTDAQQGNGYLRQWNDKLKRWEYCCLGRLCELSDLAEWVDITIKDPNGQFITISSYLHVTQYLPDEVADWAGLVRYQTSDVIDSAQTAFAGMNDDGNTFPDIAAAIPDVLATHNEDE
jgi:hypothetical protein